METAIYYFSGTGNSLKAATELSRVLKDCELLPIAGCVKRGDYKAAAGSVGFVFPLYYLGLPKMVADFIKKADLSGAGYVFAVITRGWPVVGGAIKQMKKLMKEKGRGLDFGAYIHMPMNDFTLAQVAGEGSMEKTLKSFDSQMGNVAEKIRGREKWYGFEPISFLLEKRNTPFVERVNGLDRFYSVNKSCTGCGICEKVCPADNIRIEAGKPHWNGSCQMCLACFHFCPAKAIEYENKCLGVKRYHHPDISAKQIMEQKA